MNCGESGEYGESKEGGNKNEERAPRTCSKGTNDFILEIRTPVGLQTQTLPQVNTIIAIKGGREQP